MRHLKMKELLGSTSLTIKDGGEDDPQDIVTKALEDLTKTMETRLSDIESKADNTKLAARLDKPPSKKRPSGYTCATATARLKKSARR